MNTYHYVVNPWSPAITTADLQTRMAAHFTAEAPKDVGMSGTELGW
jgi:hypothetical protein